LPLPTGHIRRLPSGRAPRESLMSSRLRTISVVGCTGNSRGAATGSRSGSRSTSAMNSSSDSGLAASGRQGAHAVVFSLARLRRARLTLLTRRRLLNPGDQFCQALHDQARGGPAQASFALAHRSQAVGRRSCRRNSIRCRDPRPPRARNCRSASVGASAPARVYAGSASRAVVALKLRRVGPP